MLKQKYYLCSIIKDKKNWYFAVDSKKTYKAISDLKKNVKIKFNVRPTKVKKNNTTNFKNFRYAKYSRFHPISTSDIEAIYQEYKNNKETFDYLVNGNLENYLLWIPKPIRNKSILCIEHRYPHIDLVGKSYKDNYIYFLVDNKKVFDYMEILSKEVEYVKINLTFDVKNLFELPQPTVASNKIRINNHTLKSITLDTVSNYRKKYEYRQPKTSTVMPTAYDELIRNYIKLNENDIKNMWKLDKEENITDILGNGFFGWHSKKSKKNYEKLIQHTLTKEVFPKT